MKSYKSAIHHAAVSIMKRPVADNIDHPSIGTVKESRLKYEAIEKAKASRLIRSRIEKYCLPPSEFADWGYPDYNDDSLCEGETQPSAEGSSQTCDRCKVPFIVSADNLEARFGECKYHSGRIAPERVEGKRKWLYSCCRHERGSVGCTDGIHVFSEKENDAALAKRARFKRAKDMGGTAIVDVLGMDCEMICQFSHFRHLNPDTVGGTSIARATLVDEDGNTLLDDLVRQDVAIL